MANPEDIEFRKLGLRDYAQLYRMIEQGTIICPKPDVWNNFYKQFVKRANPDRDLLPRILSGWHSTPNEEKNAVFIRQIHAAGEFYNSLNMKEYTWQKEIFDYFANLQGRQSELVVIWKKATVNIVVSNLVQRFRLSGTETISWFVAEGELVQFDENFDRLEQSQMRHRMLHKLYPSQTATVLIERRENFPEPHLDGNYCQFGGCSGIGDNVRPTADVRLKSDIYDCVEKAFVMPNPQIEFTLEFTEPIQRKEMALIFDPPIKYSLSSNHFTLDTDAVGGTGLWYADCKLVEIIMPKHSQAVEYTPATTENFQRPAMMKKNLFFWIFVLLVFGTFLKNSTDLFGLRSTSENSNEVQRETTKKIKVEPVELPLILPNLILMDPLKKLID